MISSSRTSLVVGAAIVALGLGCSRSQSAPPPVASTGTNTSGAASPYSERAPINQSGAATNEQGGMASSGTLDDTGLPLPRGATLVSSGTLSDVRVFPAQGDVGQGRRIVAGGVGARAVNNVYETPLSYQDAVAFYDRIFELGSESPYSRDGGAARRMTEGNATAWALTDDSGDPQRVEVTDTTPTRISIAHGSTAAAVKTERTGRANAQPGTSLGGSDQEQWDGGRHAGHMRDGGRSAPSSERDGG